jgi:hypothetical protein
MKLSEAGTGTVWLPLTPPRVAALAFAPWSRVASIQLACAACVSVAFAAFLASAWFPVVQQAIASLPETGEVRAGTLQWRGDSATDLADNPWLALSVDLHRQGPHRFPSDLHVEFASEDVRLLSIAGYLDLPYPQGYTLAFNRAVLEPWWKAREPFLVAAGALLALVAVMFCWWVLATVYAIPGLALCRFVSAGMTWLAVWKLAGAAQVPGGLAAAAGVLLYSLGAIDLVSFLFILLAQFAAAWIYIFLALFFLPAKAPTRSGRGGNPFGDRT